MNPVKADVDIPDTVLASGHRSRPAKELLLNLLTLDINQCSIKIGKTKSRKTCSSQPNK